MSTAAPAEPPRPAVIGDVALLAGVSRQTVSRVLNGSGSVSAEARRRVQDAVVRLGYEPDASARALGARRRSSAGRVVPAAPTGGVVERVAPVARHVLVTGGSGKLGRAVVAQLVEDGDRVSVVDLAHPGRDDVAWTRADLTDYGQAVGVLTGVDDRWGRPDAVVHLAALPAPGLRPDATTFAANVTTTYNVFSACRVAGVDTVVWASSETVLGLPFDVPPPYLPLDEGCGPAPTTSYSLSKTLEEEMARQFARWRPELSITGLRFSNVMEPADYAAFPGFDADPAGRRWNAWAYVDARDGARAVTAALAARLPGAELFVVANDDTVMGRPSAELAAGWFPGVPVRGQVSGHRALMSSARAQRLLGWVPRHSWRDEV
ncbi:Nucleoside-diphosphate-sugar epimerase [Klenkia soli]|uniref:Nucleoside-diphosphate-sugar epimerase n=1 Tax=Klenkia soli TaxID=1052260 RepID=A0A1H0E048_9ACTN|nr:NAD(P)-dependent oxidoreductase [Klenkia soli]SDN75708.1 Nucleoside-diphosphate-sugar epimerase [Klenkia soli]